jgi:vancomycin resistance protein YoaR
LKGWQEVWRKIKRFLRKGVFRDNWVPIVIGFSLGMLFAGYLVWLNGRVIPGVSVAGIKIGGLEFGKAYHLLSASFLTGQQKKVTLNYKKRTFDVILGTIGIQPDSLETVRRAYALGRSGPLWRCCSTMVKVSRRGVDLPVQFSHNRRTLAAFYRLLDASIGREPVRAVVRVGANGQVEYNPSITGREIDRRQLTRLFEKAVTRPGNNVIDIPVNNVSPALTSADIKRWRLNRVLGRYITNFNPRAVERTHNLKIASEALDNVIIYPGQNFSFNTWVGPRMADTGYKEAPVVYKGKLVPGIGGGVCQVSSTLYNAVLLANLKIAQRYNHSIPSAYVPLGRDATVVNGGLDFIFQNNLVTPILLTAEVGPAYLRVAVLGERTGWRKVDLTTEIVTQYPFARREVIDAKLSEGETVRRPGKPGYKVRLWRIVHYQDGTVKQMLVNTSVYPPQPEETRIGTKPDDSVSGP